VANLKYYNSVTEEWETLIVGKQGPEGPIGPGGTAAISSATPPEDTSAIWYNTENGNAYIYYDDFWTSISGLPSIPVGGTTGQVLAKASNADYATQWVAPSGLVHINTTTFSAVASQSVNDVFSSTYDSYKLVYNFTAANTATGLRFQLRVGGVDATGANYARQFVVIAGTGTAVNAGRVGGQTAYDMIDIQNKATGETMIYNPNKAEATTFAAFGGNDLASNSNLNFMTTTGNHQLSNAYTGFTIFPGTGTITGQLSVYGLAK
jgi:hypothetical protein